MRNHFTKDAIASRTLEQQMLDTKIMKASLEANVSLEPSARSGAYQRACSRDKKLLLHGIYIKPDTGLSAILQYEQGAAVVSRLKEAYDLHPLSLQCIVMKPMDCSDLAWKNQNRFVGSKGKIILEQMIPDEMPPGTVLIKASTATKLKQKILDIKTLLESESVVIPRQTPAFEVPIVAAKTSIKNEKTEGNDSVSSSIAPHSVFFADARKRHLNELHLENVVADEELKRQESRIKKLRE